MLGKGKECGVDVDDSTYRKVMAACAKANGSTQVGCPYVPPGKLSFATRNDL